MTTPSALTVSAVWAAVPACRGCPPCSKGTTGQAQGGGGRKEARAEGAFCGRVRRGGVGAVRTRGSDSEERVWVFRHQVSDQRSNKHCHRKGQMLHQHRCVCTWREELCVAPSRLLLLDHQILSSHPLLPADPSDRAPPRLLRGPQSLRDLSTCLSQWCPWSCVPGSVWLTSRGHQSHRTQPHRRVGEEASCLTSP